MPKKLLKNRNLSSMTFKIESSMIAKKAVAGKLSGEPVLYILTKGGLHAFFSKDEGKLTTLATAPHRAIGVFFAEKKAKELNKKLEWAEDFLQKNEQDVDTLIKNEDQAQSEQHYANMMQKQKKGSNGPSDQYYVYDLKANPKNVKLMNHRDVKMDIALGHINENHALRRSSLTDPHIKSARDHDDFKELFQVAKEHRGAMSFTNKTLNKPYKASSHHEHAFLRHGLVYKDGLLHHLVDGDKDEQT